MTPPLHSIISRLHLKQLRLLVALGEHGSLLKASQQVALTQPGASKTLQESRRPSARRCSLRHQPGPASPMPSAICVIRYARLIQTDLAHLRDEVEGTGRGRRAGSRPARDTRALVPMAHRRRLPPPRFAPSGGAVMAQKRVAIVTGAGSGIGKSAARSRSEGRLLRRPGRPAQGHAGEDRRRVRRQGPRAGAGRRHHQGRRSRESVFAK